MVDDHQVRNSVGTTPDLVGANDSTTVCLQQNDPPCIDFETIAVSKKSRIGKGKESKRFIYTMMTLIFAAFKIYLPHFLT